MKLYRSFILFITFFSHICTAAPDNDWGFATDWVGKYPSTSVGTAKSGLLSQTAVKAALNNILPKSEASNFSQLTSEVPVRELEGLIVVHKCRPHNCPSDMAMVVIDPNEAQLWVGLFSREKSRVSTRWYGTKEDYSILPESIKREFIERHGY